MKLDIIKAPNEILHQYSEPIKKVNKELQQFGKDLIETMEAENGLGLSAVQVGRLIRVLCMKQGTKTLLMYNPTVLVQSPTRRSSKEGCLSFPNLECIVKRPTWVKVRYIDQNNKSKMVELKDLESVIFCHELAHLNGETFDQIEDKIEIKKKEL